MTGQLICLVRHGETAWSLTGQHTGITDLPLTENGERVARLLAPVLAGREFALVLTSPLQRARRTCALAGLDRQAVVDDDLIEWNYGRYEGLTPQQIQAKAPGWMIFTDGCPDGESPRHIGERADRVIARVRNLHGPVALFAHGHIFRVLVARWLGLPVAAGAQFLLDTATVSVLGYYRGISAVKRWNAPLSPASFQRTLGKHAAAAAATKEQVS